MQIWNPQHCDSNYPGHQKQIQNLESIELLYSTIDGTKSLISENTLQPPFHIPRYIVLAGI